MKKGRALDTAFGILLLAVGVDIAVHAQNPWDSALGVVSLATGFYFIFQAQRKR